MFERLDFSNFHSTYAAEREEFCRQLVSSLKQFGFARLVNIDIPPSEIEKAFETSRDFFQLSLDQKLKSPHPPTANPHRGYSAFGIENVSAVSGHGTSFPSPLLKDMKESYDIGSQQDALYGNIWPPPGVHDTFQPTFTSFFLSCYRAELVILEAISLGLGLPGQTLGQLHNTGQSNELRLTHYPAVPRSEFSHSTRIAAHTDFGTITLLFQDDVGGLRKDHVQFCFSAGANPPTCHALSSPSLAFIRKLLIILSLLEVELPSGSGEFIDIESGGRDECILNVGDCLQIWTGLCSARHRVHLPELLAQEDQTKPSQDMVDERFSIAYFAKPNRAAILRPLLQSVATETEVGYMTAGEFQHMRISGTY